MYCKELTLRGAIFGPTRLLNMSQYDTVTVYLKNLIMEFLF